LIVVKDTYYEVAFVVWKQKGQGCNALMLSPKFLVCINLGFAFQNLGLELKALVVLCGV